MKKFPNENKIYIQSHVNKARNVEMQPRCPPPTGNGGGICSPWLRRICCILCKLFLSFVASFRSGRIGSAMEPSLPQADDATSATSSEDAERVVDHGIQAGFVGALISAVVMIYESAFYFQ
jgi:hypothetical protein